jgi:uncharacterized membrane protein YvbJ
MIHCPRCRHGNPADAAFCQECGSRLEAPCPGCGTANQSDAKFCKKCGQRLGKRQQAQEHLTTATAMYREMDMPFWLERAEAELQRP